MASQVAAKVIGTVITSSPGPIPIASKVSHKASVPLAKRMPRAAVCGEIVFKPLDERTAGKGPGIDDFPNGLHELLPQWSGARLDVEKGKHHGLSGFDC
jgi:hypothetical protein